MTTRVLRVPVRRAKTKAIYVLFIFIIIHPILRVPVDANTIDWQKMKNQRKPLLVLLSDSENISVNNYMYFLFIVALLCLFQNSQIEK